MLSGTKSYLWKIEMASLTSWILPLSVSVGLFAAGGETDNQTPSKGWLQLNQMNYSSADVTGPLGGFKASADPRTGFGIRFGSNEPRRRWEWGVGVDERFDSMRPTSDWGTPIEDKAWRPWVRGMVRYVWGDGKNAQPFLGLEVASALGNVEVNDQNYYQDLVVLMNPLPADHRSRMQGPESLTRGHFPTFQVALVGGIRFGRSNWAKPVAMAPVTAKE